MLAYITAALQLAPLLMQAGAEITPLAERLAAVFQTGAEPTADDWAFLQLLEGQQRSAIEALIPDGEA